MDGCVRDEGPSQGRDTGSKVVSAAGYDIDSVRKYFAVWVLFGETCDICLLDFDGVRRRYYCLGRRRGGH